MTQTVKVIKNLMKEHGMSQKFMAEQIGVTEAGISRWMQGKRNPDIQYVEKMAEVLGYKLSIEMEKCDVRNSYLAIKATQKQSSYDEDIATAFRIGLLFGKADKSIEEVKKPVTPQTESEK